MNLLSPQLPILIIDDEEIVLKYTCSILKKAGYTNLLSLSDPRQAEQLLHSQPVSLILLDLVMPWITGEVLLKRFRESCPETPVIVITSSSDVRTAVNAMKLGACDFMIKRVEPARLLSGISRALELRELREENCSLKRSIDCAGLSKPAAFGRILTEDPAMLKQFTKLEIAARSSRTVLITGETGTGKELAAEAAHSISGRLGELVKVNVAGISDDMFADTLFGHKRGAYTSAADDRRGLIEKAAGGTLFLDEIGDLSRSSQVKLLRVLENSEYYPIGSDSPKLSTARIITATNRNLRKAVENGSFRKDLFFRLSMNSVNLPPLRERCGDIALLADHFLKKSCAELSIPIPEMGRGVRKLLESYDFPGNVRELKALIRNAVEMGAESTGGLPEDSFREYMSMTPGWTEPQSSSEKSLRAEISFGERLPGLKESARLLIDEALKRSGGNQSEAAKMLGISQQALNNRLRRS